MSIKSWKTLDSLALRYRLELGIASVAVPYHTHRMKPLELKAKLNSKTLSLFQSSHAHASWTMKRKHFRLRSMTGASCRLPPKEVDISIMVY